MKSKISFLVILPFVLLGTQGNAQTQRGSVDENGKIQFTVKPQQANNSAGFSALNTTALNLDWSGPQINISNTPTVNTWNGQLEIGPDNSANVVYNDNEATTGLQKIMFSKKTGTTFSTPIMLDTGVNISDRNNHQPAISASPNGDLHVIYTVWNFPRNNMGYSHYTAATGTWSEGKLISDQLGKIDIFDITNKVYSTEDSLPVAVWDYDNRSGTNEIYLTYFDGTNWAATVPVSQIGDSRGGYEPKISSIGNHKAIIIYKEYTGTDIYENRYRIYDEITHTLSAAKVVGLGGLVMTEFYPVLYHDGKVNVMFSYTNAAMNDVVKIAVYDSVTDTFSLKDGSKEVPVTGGTDHQYGWDCNQSGDCAILETSYNKPISLIAYSPASGFADPQVVINSGNYDDFPMAKFDALGDLHAVWGSGGLNQEIYYKKAMNLNLGTAAVNKAKISVYPNPFHDVISISDVQNVKSVSVNDMSGRKIKNLVPSSQLNLSTLKEGVYFVNLTMKDGSVQSVKVIKK